MNLDQTPSPVKKGSRAGFDNKLPSSGKNVEELEYTIENNPEVYMH